MDKIILHGQGTTKMMSYFLIVFTLFLLTPLLVHASLTDNLLSYYKFDTDFNDTLNLVNFTHINGSTLEWGYLNKGVHIDQNNFLYTDAGTSNTWFNSTGTFNYNATVNFWSKYRYVQGTGCKSFVGFFNTNNAYAGANNFIEFDTGGSGSLGYFNIYGVAASGLSNVAYKTTPEQWTMVTISVFKNSSNWNLTLYYNGVYNNSYSGSAAIGSQADVSLQLGKMIGNCAGINGTIDELGIWNRALSSVEVTSLYNGAEGLQYPFYPSQVIIISPIGGKYNKTILINYTPATADYVAIDHYNITLNDNDSNYIQDIISNGLNLIYLWNSSMVADNNYTIHVIASTIYGLTSEASSEIFEVYNNPPIQYGTAKENYINKAFTVEMGKIGISDQKDIFSTMIGQDKCVCSGLDNIWTGINNFTTNTSFTGICLNSTCITSWNLTAANLSAVEYDPYYFSNPNGYYDSCSNISGCGYLSENDQRYNDSILANEKALPGTCPDGYAVQNTTTSGVQCVLINLIKCFFDFLENKLWCDTIDATFNNIQMEDLQATNILVDDTLNVTNQLNVGYTSYDSCVDGVYNVCEVLPYPDCLNYELCSDIGGSCTGTVSCGMYDIFNCEDLEVYGVCQRQYIFNGGNVNAGLYYGDGSQLTNLPSPFNQVLNTTSNVTFNEGNFTGYVRSEKIKNAFLKVSHGYGDGYSGEFALAGFVGIPFNQSWTFYKLDPGNNYNDTTNMYQIPIDGYYKCTVKARAVDSATSEPYPGTPGVSYGIGCDIWETYGEWWEQDVIPMFGDSPAFMWHDTSTSANGRNGLMNINIFHATAGQRVGMYGYSDDDATYTTDSSMVIELMFPD